MQCWLGHNVSLTGPITLNIKNASLLVLIITVIFTVLCCQKTDEENMQSFTEKNNEVVLMTIDPGHFHAALVQKQMYDQVSPDVYVFAPEGPDVKDHLARIDRYNNREENPTSWKSHVYTGPDYLKKLIAECPGNVMVTSGNNQKKTEYIKAAVDAGIHVLADKPMAINRTDFELLKEAFSSAERNGVLLYDIMTERYEITTLLQRELSLIPEIYGTQLKGSLGRPGVIKQSVHHFFKYVSGKKIKRPPWFFDVTQEGEGIVDVTTHLVDLIQWECFPDQIVDYRVDIEVISAKRWPTLLTPSQFQKVTGMDTYPEYLHKDIIGDSILNVYSNGEMNYKLKDVHAKVSVTWAYQAPEGGGDTHFSVLSGSKSNLVIRQGAEQDYRPVLYIEPQEEIDLQEYGEVLNIAFKTIARKYPGMELKAENDRWKVLIPEKYHVGHEAHFAQVTDKFLQYLKAGRLPDWEVPNMIAKYYTTTKALELAKTDTPSL